MAKNPIEPEGKTVSHAGGESCASAGVPGGSGIDQPLVYIVVLNYNGSELTLNCVDSALGIDYPNFRVIVVDNASTDNSAASFEKAFTDPRVELLVNGANEGYAGGNNLGIEKALADGADYIFVLNNDTIVDAGCVRPLVDAMEIEPRLGACGCPIFNAGSEGLPNFGQLINLYSGKTRAWHGPDDGGCRAEPDYICGAAVLLRARTVRRVGAFDPDLFLLYEDADLCFRIRAIGEAIRVVDSPGVRHLESQTTIRRSDVMAYYSIRNRAWFVRRYGRWYHRSVFALFQLFWLLPRHVVGCLLRGNRHLAARALRACWDGHFGHSDKSYPGATVVYKGAGG